MQVLLHYLRNRIIDYWQISYGGTEAPTYAVVKSQDSLDSIWSTLRIPPEKPEVDFTKYFLVIIQPGRTITQYKYNLNITENSATIKISLTEYHSSDDKGWLASQEPILVFKLPQNAKTIIVDIKRAPGSEGPYPK